MWISACTIPCSMIIDALLVALFLAECPFRQGSPESYLSHAMWAKGASVCICAFDLRSGLLQDIWNDNSDWQYVTVHASMGFNTQTGTQVFPSRSLFPCWIMVGHPKAAHSLPVGRRLWATAEWCQSGWQICLTGWLAFGARSFVEFAWQLVTLW